MLLAVIKRMLGLAQPSPAPAEIVLTRLPARGEVWQFEHGGKLFRAVVVSAAGGDVLYRHFSSLNQQTILPGICTAPVEKFIAIYDPPY